jgi:hypothetical protein
MSTRITTHGSVLIITQPSTCQFLHRHFNEHKVDTTKTSHLIFDSNQQEEKLIGSTASDAPFREEKGLMVENPRSPPPSPEGLTWGASARPLRLPPPAAAGS